MITNPNYQAPLKPWDSRPDMTGKKFGRYTLMEYEGGKYRHWKCMCECGNVKSVSLYHLTKGSIKSCGCLSAELLKNRTHKHGMTKTKLFGVWNSMKMRCTNKNTDKYKNYGARGIRVAEEWLDFIIFHDWAMKNGYEPGLQLDRLDTNGFYSPDNCRWVTSKVNNNNRRNNRRVDVSGVVKTLSEWSDESGIKYEILKKRLYKNCPTENFLEGSVTK